MPLAVPGIEELLDDVEARLLEGGRTPVDLGIGQAVVHGRSSELTPASWPVRFGVGNEEIHSGGVVTGLDGLRATRSASR
jgi:hypothetical protein